MELTKEISFKNKKYNIDRFYSESDSRFDARIKFIKKIQNKFEWKEALRLSKVWSNIKFKKCKYMKKLYLKIKSLDKSI